MKNPNEYVVIWTMEDDPYPDILNTGGYFHDMVDNGLTYAAMFTEKGAKLEIKKRKDAAGFPYFKVTHIDEVKRMLIAYALNG